MWFDAEGRQLAKDSYAFGHGRTKEHYEQYMAFENKERTEPPEGYTAPSTRPSAKRKCVPRTPTSRSG